MDLSNWNVPDWTVQGWGITPTSLAAPLALVTLILMARRLLKPAGPKIEQRDIGSAIIITVIIGAAFLWIFAGLGLLARIFR